MFKSLLNWLLGNMVISNLLFLILLLGMVLGVACAINWILRKGGKLWVRE